MNSGLLMTITATAKFLGFGRSKVNEMVRNGEIPVIPTGKRKGRRIDRRDVLKWVDDHKVLGREGIRMALDGRRKA